MSYRAIIHTAAGLAVLAVPCPAAVGQETPSVLRVEEPDAVVAQAFTLVRGVVELPDGRVIVTDWIEQRVAVVDLTTGDTRDLGRVGAGPKEFRMPRGLLAMPGDSTLLVDVGNSRLTVLGPELGFDRTFSMHDHGERYAMNPRAVDAEGVLYFATSAFSGGERRDSVPIARWGPGQIGVSVYPNVKIKVWTPRKRRFSFRPGMPQVAFAKQDDWAVADDGWLAVVRSEPYRVEWYGKAGEQIIGPAVSYDELPVTVDDRRDYLRHWMSTTYTSGRGEDGGTGLLPADQQSEREVNRMARSEEFAEVFPPFESVRAAPDGLLWVRRSLPAASPPTFDIFGRSGERLAIVTLRAGRRLVGFGANSLYATVADDLDLLSLERYPTPNFVR